MQDGLKAHYQPHMPHIKTKRTMRKRGFPQNGKALFSCHNVDLYLLNRVISAPVQGR